MIADTTANDSQTASIDNGAAITRCGSCASRLTLKSPSTNQPASTWLCRRCGSVYFARCESDEEQSVSGSARRVSYAEVMKAINTHAAGGGYPLPAKEIQRLVRSFARTYRGRETRKHMRHPGAAPVTAVPLAPDFRVSGQPARIVTMNLSSGGAALVHSRRIVEPYLAIDFAASGIELLPAIMEITRVRPVAAAFEIAGKFVSRILP